MVQVGKFIAHFLVATTVIIFVVFIFQNRQAYQQPFDPQRLTNLYLQSQFAPQPYPVLFTIPDDQLYAYAGWYYLTTGEISSINIEHPPLGKYFIGASILLFKNSHVGQIFWGSLFLFLSFLISFKLTKNYLIAATVPLLVFLEPLFRHQLTHSLLDLSQAVFAFSFLYLTYLIFPKEQNFNSTSSARYSARPRLVEYLKNVKDCVFLANVSARPRLVELIAGICLGATTSIKFPALAVILSASLLISFWFYKKKNWFQLFKSWLFLNLVGAFIFTLSYCPLILNSGFKAWFDLLVSAAKIHLSHVPEYPQGVVLQVLFLNQWPRWWANLPPQPVDYWQLTWPLWGLAMLLSPLIAFKKRLFKKQPVLFLFVWGYFVFLASRLFFPAYLLPLLPFGFVFLLLLPTLVSRK